MAYPELGPVLRSHIGDQHLGGHRRFGYRIALSQLALGLVDRGGLVAQGDGLG